MQKFYDYIEQKPKYEDIKKSINNQEFPLLVNGVSLENIAFFADYNKYITHKKTVIILRDLHMARQVYQDLSKFNNKVLFLQTDELRLYFVEANDRQNEYTRITTLKKIYQGDFDFLVVGVASFLRKYMPKKYYKQNKIDIDMSSKIDTDELSKKLVKLGYERTPKVEAKAEFSIRGSIIDIFSPDFANPVRIELFDDEVDSIRYFDIFSQVSISKIEKISVINCREYIYPDESERIDELSNLLEEDISEDIKAEIEKLQSKTYFTGMEKYLDYIYDEEDLSLFQFLDDCNFILYEPNQVVEMYESIYYQFIQNYETFRDKNLAIEEYKNIFYTKEDFVYKLEKTNLILITEIFSTIKKLKPKKISDINAKASPKYRGDLVHLVEDIKYFKSKNTKILISLYDKDAVKNLEKALNENDITVKVIENQDFDVNNFDIFLTKDGKNRGIYLQDADFLYLTNNDIFMRVSRPKPKKNAVKSQKINSFIELKKGDIVVHETYGIGRFSAIEQRENNGVTKDFIKIVYKDGDTIYVPINQMDKVQKYIGTASDKVTLSKLGSTSWKKQKTKAQKAVEEIAKYLVELYSIREHKKGYAFSKDTFWQREFESLFPFEETPDQLKAIEDIKCDMESQKPMDRLVCGDVGYGKTEVALRAIFKAVMDQKQVAFLVPTTILAEQHFKTLSERFENYPITVDSLSRFKTKKQQNLVVEGVKAGTIDVVVGTHRILSKDMSFKDLGLLVIDEEQRFGVKDKEKIKQLKNNVDVLTLTATPIPRTLNMSLSGIRDMSTLETPPNDRHPIATYVTEALDGIIVDAIQREIMRNGQVYFVYNVVHDIDRIKKYLNTLMPDLRIAVAHGQMNSNELEDIMIDFMDKKYDLLLCTTIIETGMDISNVNTIIIYNADKMGISQLYQLRGRVGRSSRQSYAYLLYEKDKVLTEVASKRLKTIKEFTEFGSGFKIAMMDLEIRGSGNLLGESQSGHIEEVGYDLYIKMLGKAFNALKGVKEEEKTQTEVYLNVDAYIPDNYIQDELQKIEIYKKIASIEDKEDYFGVQSEIEDRFSDIPESVENLLKISRIRSLGERIGIDKISQNGVYVIYSGAKQKLKQRVEKDSTQSLLKNVISFLEKLAG